MFNGPVLVFERNEKPSPSRRTRAHSYLYAIVRIIKSIEVSHDIGNYCKSTATNAVGTSEIISGVTRLIDDSVDKFVDKSPSEMTRLTKYSNATYLSFPIPTESRLDRNGFWWG